MTLGTDLAAALPGLRREAESRMTDRCEIITNVEDTIFDPDTNSYVLAPAVYSYRGPCRVKADNTQPRDVDAVGQPLTTTSLSVHLPVVASKDVRTGHVIVITGASSDPDLLGRRYRVTSTHNQTSSTARRLPVDELLHG